MKKVFALSLILALVIVSASFGAVQKKTVTQVTTIKVQNPQTAKAEPASSSNASSGISIGPKLTMVTGDYNGLSIGVESYFSSPMPGVQFGAEGNYKLATNNVSWIQIGGIGRYMIPMEGQMFMPYAGGGLNYNMYSMTGGSASGIGFKIFGGADFPVAGVGTFFGNVGYASQTFNYTVPGITIGGQTFGGGTVSASGSGLYIEGGDRITL